MSVELERDLRTYTAYLNEILPTIIADEIRAETYPLAPGRPPKRQRRKVLVAAVAAFATLVLIGGVALLSGPRNGSAPVATQPPAPTIVQTTPAPAPAPTVAPTLEAVSLSEVADISADAGIWVDIGGPPGCSTIADVTADSLGRIWLWGGCGGLHRLEEGRWVTVFDSGPSSPTILGDVHAPVFRGVAEAPDGTIWVAAVDDVITYDGTDWSVLRPWEFSTPDDQIRTRGIHHLAVTAQDDAWAIHGSRVMHWNGQAWTQLSGAPDDAHALGLDSTGRLWVAGSTALHVIDDGQWNFVEYPAEAGGAWTEIEALEVASDGETVWIGRFEGPDEEFSGLLAWNRGTWHSYDFGGISDIEIHPDGSVWAAGRNGVFRYDGTVWTRHRATPDGGGSFGGLAVDNDGAVWVSAMGLFFQYTFPAP